MKRSCQHCGDLIVGSAYRVTSEEDNVLLNPPHAVPASGD